MDPVLEELFGILSTYAVHDVRIPYYGPVTGYLPVTHVVVSAKMRGEFMRQDTPEHWREDALVRVHEMLADLENHLWVRTESPDIRFRGDIVQPARVTVDGKLAALPIEAMLSCEVSVDLDRLTGRLSELVPSDASV